MTNTDPRDAEVARLRQENAALLDEGAWRQHEVATLTAQLAAAQADNAALRRALEQCESPGQPVPGENWWWCKIGPAIPGDPINDNAMRTAAEGAFQQLTGRPSGACFSGWGASLTEGERDVFEDRGFRPQSESGDPKWKALATPAPGAPWIAALRGLADEVGMAVGDLEEANPGPALNRLISALATIPAALRAGVGDGG